MIAPGYDGTECRFTVTPEQECPEQVKGRAR